MWEKNKDKIKGAGRGIGREVGRGFGSGCKSRSELDGAGGGVGGVNPEAHYVEVLYAELKRVQWICMNNRILNDWIRSCVRESYQDWRHLLPVPLCHSDLKGYVLSADAQNFQDIAGGRRAVIVELNEEEAELGFSTKNRMMEEKIEKIEAQLAQLMRM